MSKKVFKYAEICQGDDCYPFDNPIVKCSADWVISSSQITTDDDDKPKGWRFWMKCEKCNHEIIVESPEVKA